MSQPHLATKLKYSTNSNYISNSHSQFPNQKMVSSHVQTNNHFNSNQQISEQIQSCHSQSDYELVIQFQLRRQRQKNRILEERLHNKQVFIQQMKQYQQQLTIAFERCQQQLASVRKSAENFVRLQRDYLEQIADLKHLVIRLEDQVTIRDKEVQRRHCSSVKLQQPLSPIQSKQQRSKTLMNNEESTPTRLNDPLQQELVKQSKKIVKFLKQFLMMTECFECEAKQGSLKHRLKIAWKWIKVAIKEWNQFKREKTITDDKKNSEQQNMRSFKRSLIK